VKVTISSTWLRQPWSMPVWDMAYDYLVRAGSGDEKAKKELLNITLAGKAGNELIVGIKRNFDAVAKLILKGLPKPSEFVRSRARKSPLLPGARGTTPQMTATVKRQQEQIRKQREQIAAQKRESIVRAQKGKLMSQAQQRVAALKTAHDVELAQIEDQLAAVEKMLENRNIADDMRRQLEAQADGYEALIEKLKLPDAVNASEPATETSEAMAAEQVEAEQDDAATAYSSGVPGDVEFADAGT